MADHSKLNFINTEFDTEATTDADSLKFTSYKTATYELTDTLLGQLTNDVILRTGVRPWTADQSVGGFKFTNLAPGTAGTDAVNLDQLTAALNAFDWKESARLATFNDTNWNTTVSIDVASGTGVMTITGLPSGTSRGLIDGVEPVDGDRIVMSEAGTASALTTDGGGEGTPKKYNGIWEVTGGTATTLTLTRTTDADEDAEVTSLLTIGVEEGTIYAACYFKVITPDPITVDTTAIDFVKFAQNLLTGGDGISIAGSIVSADLLASGGLKFVGATPNGQIAVEPADFAGTGLQDDGADNLEIDFYDPGTPAELLSDRAIAMNDLSTNGAGQGSNAIGVDPTNIPQSSETVLQLLLEDLAAAIGDGDGITYTVGAGGVTKGDAVYVSAADTVLPFPVTGAGNTNKVIGIANETVAAAGQVLVKANDTVVTGVLTTLTPTPGDIIYWDGSALVLAGGAPGASGSKVVQCGVAKNANDLHVEVEPIVVNG